MKRTVLARLAIGVLVLITIAACGGDDEGSGAANTTESTQGAAAATDDSSDTDSSDDDTASDAETVPQTTEAAADSGNVGTLVLGDETIVLDSARCFLEEQDAAAGGGKILFVGQGFGTNAAGDSVLVDVSRFDEDSQFTGDDIIVDIGEIGTGVSWQITADLGTVQLDGRTMSASGLDFVNWDDGAELRGSFDFAC